MAYLKISFGGLEFKCMSLNSVFSSEILLMNWGKSIVFLFRKIS